MDNAKRDAKESLGRATAAESIKDLTLDEEGTRINLLTSVSKSNNYRAYYCHDIR